MSMTAETNETKRDIARACDDAPRWPKPIEVRNPRYAKAAPEESSAPCFGPWSPTKP